MLEELRRRNYAESTIHIYIHTIEHFSRHFHHSPDQLGPEHIRQYQAALFTRRKAPAHPQLRISRSPTASRAPSALSAVAPALWSARSRRHIVRATHSHAMAMSALRRNHASCRAPLRRATPPPIPASSQPVRRMNPNLQPRISLALRHAHWFCVSHSSECGTVVRSRLSDAPPHGYSLCDPLLKPKRSDSNGALANDQGRLIQIQIP
jgi:hypothetical protein